MLNPEMLYNKIISMPPDVAEEVNDFVDFVMHRNKKVQSDKEEKKIRKKKKCFQMAASDV